MLNSSPAEIILRRYKIIILAGLVLAVGSVLVTVIFPLKYRADAQALVIVRSQYGVDPYTVVKSAEMIGENLAQIVETTDFFNKVIVQPDYALDQSEFANVSERTKRKRWQDAVDASMVFGTGVLNVSAYHEDPEEAKQYAGAVIAALVTQGPDYVGGNVTLRVINTPVATSLPARPNVLMNAILGFAVGVAGMGILVLRKTRV